MEPHFWLGRWQVGQIGFHQAGAEPLLIKHFAKLGVPTGGAIFVPLCGKSLDLIWLADGGTNVTGVELSSLAVEAFWLENGLPARRTSEGRFESFASGRLRIIRGDFFELDPEILGPVAAVYDRASLVAWPPELRPRYVAQQTRITQPGTKTLLITLDYPQHETQGPPFSVPDVEVQRLYRETHHVELLDRNDILGSDARMRSRGVTELHQACYLLERL